ncbi:MAG: hypothetical protein WCG83_02770 [Candidatus Peregrinibacteria bacterium]
MDKHLHQYRPAFRFSAEGRVISFSEKPPESGRTNTDTPSMSKDTDIHWKNIEHLKSNDQFSKDLTPMLETLAHDPHFGRRYEFLADPTHGNQHKALVLSLIFAEAGRETRNESGEPQAVKLQHRRLQSFSAVSEKAFKDDLGGGADLAFVKGSVKSMGLEKRTEELYAVLKGTGDDNHELYRDAAFRAWLETWYMDYAKLKNEKDPDLVNIYNWAVSPDNKEGKWASLEMTLLRYRSAVEGIIAALGGGEDGKAEFWKLKEEDRVRLVSEVWYGGIDRLKRNIAVLGDPDGRGKRFVALLCLFRNTISRHRATKITDPDLHPFYWSDKDPDHRKAACDYLRSKVFSQDQCEKVGLGPEYALLVKAAEGKESFKPNEVEEIDGILRLLAPAVDAKNRGSEPTDWVGLTPPIFQQPGHLGEVQASHDIIKTVGSSVERIKKGIPGFSAETMKLLGQAYVAKQFDPTESAENWLSNPSAAYGFLNGLPPGPLFQTIKPSEFFVELTKYAKGETCNKKEMVRNILRDLAEELISKQLIQAHSAEAMEDRSGVAAISVFFKDGRKEFMKLIKKHPLVGLAVGAVFVKMALGILFTKEKWGGLARLAIGGGALGLLVADKYNPWNIKDRAISMVSGDRWKESRERYYANLLTDEKDKRVVEDPDDFGHRAILYLGQAPTKEVMDYHVLLTNLPKGIVEEDLEKALAGRPIPSFVTKLRDSTTKPSDVKIAKTYKSILDSFFARYSTVSGGPVGGVGPKRATGGWESRVVDGRNRVENDAIKAEVITQYATHQNDLMTRAYIQAVSHCEIYGRPLQSDGLLAALNDVENKNAERVSEELLHLTGPELQRRAEEVVRKDFPQLYKEMKAKQAAMEGAAGYCTRPDVGGNIHFSVVMNTLMDSSSLERFQMEQSGLNRYLYSTKRASVGTRIELGVLDAGDDAVDLAKDTYAKGKKLANDAREGIPKVLDKALGVAEGAVAGVQDVGKMVFDLLTWQGRAAAKAYLVVLEEAKKAKMKIFPEKKGEPSISLPPSGVDVIDVPSAGVDTVGAVAGSAAGASPVDVPASGTDPLATPPAGTDTTAVAGTPVGAAPIDSTTDGAPSIAPSGSGVDPLSSTLPPAGSASPGIPDAGAGAIGPTGSGEPALSSPAAGTDAPASGAASPGAGPLDTPSSGTGSPSSSPASGSSSTTVPPAGT